MQLGIFAKTFPRPTLEESLDAVVAHGLTHIQFNMSCMGLPTLPDRLDEGSCVWIAQALHERGLTMAAISGTFNMCEPSDSRLEHNLRRFEVLAGACRWLDTRIITLCTGTLDSHDMWKWHADNVRKRTWERLIQTMREAVKIADRHEVTLAFEPEINNIVNSTMKARRLLDEIDSPWLKVVIDPANLLRSGDAGRMNELFDEAFEWLGPDVVLAHAKEPRFDDADQVTLKRISEDSKHRIVRARTRELMRLSKESALGDTDPETIRELLQSPEHSLLRELVFHFYHPYFVWLKKIGYAGAVVIHGLEESEVNRRAPFLRKVLEARPRGI